MVSTPSSAFPAPTTWSSTATSAKTASEPSRRATSRAQATRAEAYARVSGRPGVVVTTSGPGLTNAMTAAATAYAESQPVLLLSSGMPTGAEGRDIGQLHEAKNVSGAMDQLVRWSRRVARRRRGGIGCQRGVQRIHRAPSTARTHRDSRRRAGAGLDRRAEGRHAGGRARAGSGCRSTRCRPAFGGRPAADHRRRRGRRRTSRTDRACRGARCSRCHHRQRQGHRRREASTVGRRVDPAAGAAEGRSRQRRAPTRRHRTRRLRPVGGPDPRAGCHPLRHRPRPAGQELPGRPCAVG